jgi:hypothetical protein
MVARCNLDHVVIEIPSGISRHFFIIQMYVFRRDVARLNLIIQFRFEFQVTAV